jgi:hypothetical protein
MTTSFATDIAPLFTAHDLACMQRRHVDLDAFAYMADPAGDENFPDHGNARNVLARLDGSAEPRMPMGGPYWPAARIQLFQQWMTDGFPA